eukprot:198640_1
MLLPMSSGTVWADRIVITIATMHNLIIFVYILRLNLVKKEVETTHPSLYRSLFYVTIICMSLMVGQDINVFFISSTMLSPASCKLLSSTSTAIFFLAKSSVWYFNVIRVDLVFYATRCAYSQLLIISLKLLISAAALFFVLFICVYQMYFENEYQIYESQYQSCVTVSAHTSALVWVVFESMINVTCFWLFWRKIKIIQSDTVLSSDEAESLTNVVRKYAVLIGAAMVSNYVLILLTFMTDLGYAFSTVDTMISIWYLVLFDQRFDSIYRKVFRCMVKASEAHPPIQSHVPASFANTRGGALQIYSFETIPTMTETETALSIGIVYEGTHSVPK